MTCRRCGCDRPRVKVLDDLCVSVPACTKRLRTRVGVRVVLENPPVLTPESAQSVAEREIRRLLYANGCCVDCGRPHAPGHPRCWYCHHLPQVVRALLR